MSISSVGSFMSGMPGLGATDPTRQNSPKGSAVRTEMEEIREKGLTVWAHEQRMEALKAKLRKEILSDKKVSEQNLAGMPAEQRNSVEDEIQKLIGQKLRDAMQRAVEDAAKTGKTEAVLIDIAV